MGKPGRNDPCPCGSGQKYKKCCAKKDAAAESERLAQNKTRLAAPAARHRAATMAGGLLDEGDDELTRDSNAVLDLIQAGQFEEAETAAHALLENYPQVHDGYTRLGKLFEARGDRVQAAHWYRRSVQFMRENADRHDPEYIEIIEQRVRNLEE